MVSAYFEPQHWQNNKNKHVHSFQLIWSLRIHIKAHEINYFELISAYCLHLYINEFPVRLRLVLDDGMDLWALIVEKWNLLPSALREMRPWSALNTWRKIDFSMIFPPAIQWGWLLALFCMIFIDFPDLSIENQLLLWSFAFGSSHLNHDYVSSRKLQHIKKTPTKIWSCSPRKLQVSKSAACGSKRGSKVRKT